MPSGLAEEETRIISRFCGINFWKPQTFAIFYYLFANQAGSLGLRIARRPSAGDTARGNQPRSMIF